VHSATFLTDSSAAFADPANTTSVTAAGIEDQERFFTTIM
jgi:hypothetical protein